MVVRKLTACKLVAGELASGDFEIPATSEFDGIFSESEDPNGADSGNFEMKGSDVGDAEIAEIGELEIGEFKVGEFRVGESGALKFRDPELSESKLGESEFDEFDGTEGTEVE